jgi:AcrR family transcriptional regulator
MEYIFFEDISRIKGINKPKSRLGFERMTKICAAAETLFDEKGFYDTSINDICKLAKIAVGTFYIYFQDKKAIYNYLVKNYYAVITNYLRKHIKDCKTRYEMEREGIKAFIRFGSKNPQCYKIIWGSSYIDPAVFEDYYTRFAASYIASLKRFSAELTNIDLPAAAWCLMGITTFVCLKVIFTHKRLTEKNLDLLADDVMKLLREGLLKKSPARQKKATAKK